MKAEFFLQQIKNEFPQIKWNKYRIVTHGWDHVVIILDKKLIFRFPKNKDYKKDFENEIQLLYYLKKKVNVGIPAYDYVSKNKSFAGYKILNGLELKLSQFRHFPASEKEKFAKQIADFLSSLHTIPKSVIIKYNVQAENQTKDYNKFVCDTDTKKLVFPRLNKEEVQIIERYFNELKATLNHTYSNTLIHNDLTWEHILWDSKKKQVNIIDFSDRTFGDPASDFAGLWEYGKKFVNKVYELYQGKKDDTLLYRSQLYFKKIPLSTMKGALNGQPCSFKEGYKVFRKTFKI